MIPNMPTNMPNMLLFGELIFVVLTCLHVFAVLGHVWATHSNLAGWPHVPYFS